MRRGWRTTEFWVTALTGVGALAASVVGILPATAAATVAGVGAAAYAIARGLTKVSGK